VAFCQGAFVRVAFVRGIFCPGGGRGFCPYRTYIQKFDDTHHDFANHFPVMTTYMFRLSYSKSRPIIIQDL